ncbi:MAG TPA: envelope stress response membrane protein PspC [Chitinispirillaceae bacterium]|nr:envelope stress response membrane protein PspC [Chitinispirillaceae bacterium]
MSNYRTTLHKKLYRSRSGMILGVCRGFADFFGVNVLWIRILTIICFILSGFWPLIPLYLASAFLMKPEPVIDLSTDDESEFYESYTSSRPLALHRLKRQFDSLDRRIQRMEDTVTKRDFTWEQRLRNNPSDID